MAQQDKTLTAEATQIIEKIWDGLEVTDGELQTLKKWIFAIARDKLASNSIASRREHPDDITQDVLLQLYAKPKDAGSVAKDVSNTASYVRTIISRAVINRCRKLPPGLGKDSATAVKDADGNWINKSEAALDTKGPSAVKSLENLLAETSPETRRVVEDLLSNRSTSDRAKLNKVSTRYIRLQRKKAVSDLEDEIGLTPRRKTKPK